ncbi:RNA-binding protein [Chryseomicrobium sp. FSL W7-1435]|uniref:YlmH family RNA-binding protein n=1 Tax=Chryseomicrobium sp. FSL W7-1435 TaxID=2921704 RepID=UPI00315A3ED9
MDSIFQHFRKEEQPFIEAMISLTRDVEDRYAPKLTDFLDPRQRFILQTLSQQRDLQGFEFGGFEQGERKRVLVAPSYYEPLQEDALIQLVKVTYPIKFVTLKHSDVLGALMSLGLDRSKFGDIRLQDGVVQIAMAAEILDYVKTNLTSIGKVKVQVEAIEETEVLLHEPEEYVEELHIVSSMRLDTVLASAWNISRQKAAAFIKGGKVKVNWSVVEDISFSLNESDMISLRTFGRFQVGLVEGRTKKEKIRLQLAKLEQKN